jgi:hypothetical protein
MQVKSLVSLFAAVLISLGLTACGKKEQPAPAPTPAPAPAPAVQAPAPAPVSVKAVTLGNAIGDTKQVTAPMSTFGKKDTIYAVVETVGTGKATLKADWTFHKGDKAAPVNSTTQEIDAAGPANSEFHVSKPDGWPVGDYQVEVFLNGTSAGTQKFNVK